MKQYVSDYFYDERLGAWVRMPKPKQRLCGLSRTTILELSESGLIRTVAIRKPGAIKGIRLVYVPSLLEYLETLTPKEV